MGALLQLIGEPPDDQIATEAQGQSGCDAVSARRAAAPVSTDRPTRRFRHQAPPGLGLADGRFGRRLDRDPRTARQSPFCPTLPGFGTSERLLAEARRLSGDDRFSSITRLKGAGMFG